MTTPASTGKVGFFVKYLLYRLFREKGLLITSVICGLLTLPLLCAAALFSINYLGGITDTIRFDLQNAGQLDAMLYVDFLAVILSFAAVLISLVISFILPARLFCYNLESHSTDMYFSLPLSRGQLFLGDFTAGMIITAAPLLLSIGVGLPMLGAVRDAFLALPQECAAYRLFAGSGSLDKTCGNLVNTVCIGVLCFVLLVIFTYIFGVFMSVCCGKTADSMAFTLMLHILPPAAVAVAVALVFVNSYGVNYTPEMSNALRLVPPVGLIISVFMKAFDGAANNYTIPALTELVSPALIITLILIAAALAAAAYLLSRRRKAEQTGKPFVFDIFYHIISLGTVLCIAAFFVLIVQTVRYDTLPFYITMIIICAVVYLLFEVVHKRGFSKLWVSGIRFAAVIVLSCTLLPAVSNMTGAAISGYAPDLSAVQSVTVKGGALNANVISDGRFELKELCYTDSGDIEKIRQLHKALMDGRCSTASNIYHGNTLQIVYRLTDGGEVCRTYNVNYEYVDTVRDTLRGTSQYDELMYGRFDGQEPDNLYAWYYGTDYGTGLNTTYTDKSAKLIKAVRADLAGGGFDSGEIKAVLTFTAEFEDEDILEDRLIYVTENCRNTLAFLADKGNTETTMTPEDIDIFIVDPLLYTTQDGVENYQHSFTIAADDSEEQRELFSMMKLYTDEFDGSGAAVTVTMRESITMSYYIDESDGQRARELLRRIVEEKGIVW